MNLVISNSLTFDKFNELNSKIANPPLFTDVSGPYPLMKKDEQYKFFMEECQGCFLELDSQPIVTFILFDIQTELRLSNIEIVVNNSLSLETNFAKCRQLLLDLSEAQGIEKFVCFRTSVDMNKPIESLEAMEFSRQGVLSEQVFFCNRYHDLEIWQWHRPKERLETRLEDLSDPGAKL